MLGRSFFRELGVQSRALVDSCSFLQAVSPLRYVLKRGPFIACIP